MTIDDRRFAALRRVRPADYLVQKFARLLSRLTRHALIDRTRHPLLTAVLSRIIKDERRHFSFYFNQARLRLQPRAARIMTSLIVRNFWTPVGSPVRGDADARRICRYLFGNEQGPRRLAEHDSMIARLPGLGWFDMASRYCFGARTAGPLSSPAPIAQS